MVRLFHALDMCYEDPSLLGKDFDGVGMDDIVSLHMDRAVMALSGEAKICMADMPLGQVGLIIAAEVSDVFCCDVHSISIAGGERSCEDWHDEDRAEDLDHSSEEEVWGWMRDVASKMRGRHNNARSYSEVWGNSKAPVAVFLSEDVGGRHRQWQEPFAKALAKELDIPIVEVDRYNKIWDIQI